MEYVDCICGCRQAVEKNNNRMKILFAFSSYKYDTFLCRIMPRGIGVEYIGRDETSSFFYNFGSLHSFSFEREIIRSPLLLVLFKKLYNSWIHNQMFFLEWFRKNDSFKRSASA